MTDAESPRSTISAVFDRLAEQMTKAAVDRASQLGVHLTAESVGEMQNMIRSAVVGRATTAPDLSPLIISLAEALHRLAKADPAYAVVSPERRAARDAALRLLFGQAKTLRACGFEIAPEIGALLEPERSVPVEPQAAE